MRVDDIGFASVEYDIIDDLTLLVRSAIDSRSSNNERRYWNDSYIIAQNGNYQVRNNSALEWNNNDFLLTYKRDFNR